MIAQLRKSGTKLNRRAVCSLRVAWETSDTLGGLLVSQGELTGRTLDEITEAVRRNEPVTAAELKYSVSAYDVLLAMLKLDENPVQLKSYMVAGDSCPKAYIGPANDPLDPEVQEWHKAFKAVK
tara:strand:- start:167 stop:538 length:372 start_codon:yes stop_codon:yes gene_type:complete